MTLIAGIVSRRGRPIPAAAIESLERSISRHPGDKVNAFQDDRSYFAKVDLEAFRSPGLFVDSTGAASLLTGEPLLGNRDARASSNRQQDLMVIHEQCLKDNWNIFREANGTFNIVHYQPQSQRLTFIADKVGVRPLYFWVDDDVIVFAGALRILAANPLVPKKMDLRAVTELVALGAPLAYRTPYAGISVLQAAEVVQITNKTISRSSYWRWDETENTNEPESSQLKTVYDSFQTAVAGRIRSDKITSAFLSGGLDSRCAVAVLRHQGIQVHTFNFARPGTQDYVFGNDFAQRIGSIHQSIPKERGDDVPDYSTMMARALRGLDQSPYRPEHPNLVWSGEGGSVLLGHVHLNEKIVELTRAGNQDGAIDAFLEREQAHVPLKLFQPRILENVSDVLQEGIREELLKLNSRDPGRNFYLFLLLNDQRRKLAQHFEDIDLHRLEFQFPFFDGLFLESILALPLDSCLRHKFYVKWLSQFPSEVTAVPWQAYPEHEPCPVSMTNNLAYQWDLNHQAKEASAKKWHTRNQVIRLLASGEFPNNILSKRNLGLAAVIDLIGWRDFQYAFEAAQTYYGYAKKCGGEVSL